MSKEGLYRKYEVRKDGELVENCFVLEPQNDPAAREALHSYAKATENDQLQQDLETWLVELGHFSRCDEHPDREAVVEYEDGTKWCQSCHEANLGASTEYQLEE